MIMFNKVVIIGTGLIGGSLGLALKKQRLAVEVVGLSRHLQNARIAKKMGAIDFVGRSLAVVADADLVILATPVNTIIEIAVKIAKKIKKDCVVIDVGSTKKQIVTQLESLIPNFIGTHPLAGSEKKGILNLDAHIFRGSVCIITPGVKTAKKALAQVEMLWQALGAQIVKFSAAQHDQVLGLTSHLPHLVAFALIDAIPERYLKFSANGLRDTTRIAGSDTQLWNQIFMSNRGNLLAGLKIFQIKLSALMLALKNKDKTRLAKILLRAKTKRDKLG